ncbi:CHAT domain-containing tetratricopeptide repeat protein [uncultured Aquimarina sp.]|uniref:CHAT domain-containing protein n=1 Tax=uncultured Aquimarina sp. TaxID=575652 RepID=UPI00261C8156|nr:CHAT domain-containing tetratricopeptide repeat protein [uncultured Aquimarina sp.]
MNPLKTIVFFLFVTSFSFSQTETAQDTLLASQYFKKGDSLLAERKLDSSIVYFKKSLPIYEKAKAWERVAGCYNGISIVYWRSKNINESYSNSKRALYINNTYLKMNNKQKAVTFDNIGHYYRLKNEYDKALEYFKKALYIRQSLFLEDHYKMGTSYTNIGSIYYYKSDYLSTVFYFEKALEIELRALGFYHKRIESSCNNLAVVYDQLGDLNKALEYYKKSLAITIKISGINNMALATTYNNLGVTYINLRQYDNALSCYKKAIAICVENNDLSSLDNIYNNMGVVYKNKGEHSRALEYYKKSLNFRIKRYGNEHSEVGDIYMNMGIIFKNNKEFDKAQEYYDKALNNYKIVFGEKHIKIAPIYENIGNLNAMKKSYNLALEYQTKALEVYKGNFGNNSPKISVTYISISDIYLEQGNYSDALRYSKKAIQVLQNLYGDNSPILVEVLNQEGTIYLKQGNYEKATVFFDKALKVNTKRTHSKDYFNQYYNSKMLLETYIGKAKSFLLNYQKSGAKKDLYKNKEIYNKLDLLLEQTQRSFRNYQDKVSFAKQTKDIYTDAIKTYTLLHEETKEEQPILDAFHYAEKGKANILKDLLTDSDARTFSGLPNNLLKLEKDLRTNKAFYQSKINKEFSKKESDSVKTALYENKLFDISRRQDSLTEVLEKNYPKYHQLKYQNEVISVAEIQQKLDKNTTVLEFFTADSTTYAFTVSKNKITVKELSTPKLTEQIEQFRSSMTKNYEEYKDSSHLLYQKLIAPLKKELTGNQLIIVPDGPLWHLNFDLLFTEEEISNNPRAWPYLLKEYAISYANSATLLFGNKMREESVSKEEQECLAFSFSSGDNTSATRNVSLKTFRNSSMDLPGTREEIKAIANIVDGQYFYGSEATEENFKKHAGAYDILHLALHGDVDNERPENSKLYFTKSKDTIEDNYLYSHELFALDIPAELTVLSACNTGTGKIAKGEGIMSLGNAFQYAGTKSLLLTNWEVSDETTPKIMEYFYTNLKEGKNKAEALQQAKLQFLTTTSEETYHPYYWGGFYLLGDTTTIQFQDNNYIYWLIGFGILAVIILSLFWYRKKRSSSEVIAKAFLS